MTLDELIEEVRQQVFIGDETVYEDFDDARLRLELTNELRTTFGRAVCQVRQGFWLKQAYYEVVPGVAKYRIPPRAMVGGLENVAIAVDGGKYVKLQEVTETHALFYEVAPGGVGSVQKYVIRSDQVVLLPTPAQSYLLRMSYYLRPSRLVAPQALGRITNVDVDTRVLALTAAVPTNFDTAAPITIGDLIDVVHTTGWAEVALVGAPVINIVDPGTGEMEVTVGGTDALDEIVVGDYLRAAEQTDWPCLPEEVHSTLAKAAAVKVMNQLHMMQKKAETGQLVAGEISNWVDQLKSRVKAEAPVLKAPRSILQLGRSTRGFYGWRG